MRPTGRGLAGGAAGQDPAVDGVEVVLAEQRQVGLGHRQHGPRRRPRAPAVARSSSASSSAAARSRVERVGDRAELHQRVEQDDVARRPGQLDQGDASRRAARPWRPGGAPRAVASRLELGVGELDARRRSGPARSGQVWARCASQLSRIISLPRDGHRRDNPRRADSPQGRPARGAASTRRSNGAAAGEYEDILYETRRRDREDHDQPARGAKRLSPADAGRASRRLRAGPRRPRGRRRSSSPAPATRRSAPAATSGSAATTATSATTRWRSRASAASTSATSTSRSAALPKPVVAMVAGYAVGGGHILHLVCDLTIAADNARFGQTGPRVGQLRRRLRRRPAGPQRRRQAGQGDLVPVPPLRRRGGAARWGSSTRSSRSPTSSARRSPGAAR